MFAKGKPARLAMAALALTVALACGLLLPACSANDSAGNTATVTKSTAYPTLESLDLNGKTVGVETGTIFGACVEERYPQATVKYFSSYADMIEALRAGKVDAFAGDEPIANYAASAIGGLSYVDDSLVTAEIGLIFPKTQAGEELQGKMNEFLARLEEEGQLDALQAKWVAGAITDDSMPDYASFPATNGTLNIACQSSYAPFVYLGEDGYKGYEMEIIALFCQEYGYAMNVMDMDFAGVLSAVSVGKCDVGADCLSITAERAESVNFSSPHYVSRGLLYTKQTDADIAAANTAITCLADLDGKRIGVLVGSACMDQAAELAGSSGEVLYFNSLSDLGVALNSNKIDAYIYDEPGCRQMCAANPSQVMLDEQVDGLELVVAFKKDDARATNLCNQLNAYLAKIKADGTLESLCEKWMEQVNTADQTVDYENLPATNGTVVVATFSGVGAPIAYVKDNKIVGYDIEIMAGFCKEYGYAMQLEDYEFTGLLAAVQSGKCDVGACGITATAERAESMLLSDSTFEGGMMCVVKSGESQDGGFLAGLAESFTKTFVTEGRWQLFVGGILRTLLITVAALVLGTLLGFAAFVWCRNGGRVRNRIVDFLVWLIQGMPVVVFLMILFYIIFGATSLSGEVVSIVGFTLIFATVVVGLLRVGVSSVDKGQEEAAYTLGFTRNKAFFRIVLPQAVRHVLPSFRAELVTLLKGTAIVGYIAVQDLTKVGDIIRSRTYEAFFPLIAVAVIYFVLAALLKAAVNVIARKTDPCNRTPQDILAGITPEGEGATAGGPAAGGAAGEGAATDGEKAGAR